MTRGKDQAAPSDDKSRCGWPKSEPCYSEPCCRADIQDAAPTEDQDLLPPEIFLMQAVEYLEQYSTRVGDWQMVFAAMLRLRMLEPAARLAAKLKGAA